MIICRVKGCIISTRKDERLVGCKFLVVEPVGGAGEFIAADNIGAGVGETVMVARGSAARIACNKPDMPIDAAVVGIIDEGTC
jgi:ethanolamine utilization protein EutN